MITLSLTRIILTITGMILLLFLFQFFRTEPNYELASCYSILLLSSNITLLSLSKIKKVE